MSEENTDSRLPDAVREHRDEILQAAARRGARNVRVFSSFVRGAAGPERDVDLVVDLESGRSLLDLGGLQMDLQELVDRPMYVATESSLRKGLRERVLREAVPFDPPSSGKATARTSRSEDRPGSETQRNGVQHPFGAVARRCTALR